MKIEEVTYASKKDLFRAQNVKRIFTIRFAI